MQHSFRVLRGMNGNGPVSPGKGPLGYLVNSGQSACLGWGNQRCPVYLHPIRGSPRSLPQLWSDGRENYSQHILTNSLTARKHLCLLPLLSPNHVDVERALRSVPVRSRLCHGRTNPMSRAVIPFPL